MSDRIFVTCPNCNASFNAKIEEGLATCEYCGSAFNVDEAGTTGGLDDDTEIQKYEYELKKKKEIERAEQQMREEAERNKLLRRRRLWQEIFIGVFLIIAISVCCIMFSVTHIEWFETMALVFSLLLVLLGYISFWPHSQKKKKEDPKYSILKTVPAIVEEQIRTNYIVMEDAFKSAGFTNIRCVPMNDLMVGFFDKPSTVAKVTINGENITSGGAKYSPDVSVIISYHSFRDK